MICLGRVKAPLDVAAVQVQAYIRGNAVTGVVQGALEDAGTPNALAQTDLSQVL